MTAVQTSDVLVVIQARMASRRLPGKVLAPIGGEPLLVNLIRYVRRARHGSNLVVATTIRGDDDAIAQCAERAGVPVYRGAVDDVVGRFLAAAHDRPATCMVRVTADNPFTDPGILDSVVDYRCDGSYDYVHAPNAPVGTAVDVITVEALRICDRKAETDRHREHLNAFVLDHPDEFRVGIYDPPASLRRPDVRVTVDTQHDLDHARRIHDALRDPETATVEEIIQAADSLTARTPS